MAAHARAQHIKDLIASLADSGDADLGSPMILGPLFSPIPVQGLDQSPALRELVTLGPEAMPFLLDALGDNSPTSIVITLNRGLGEIWFGRELPINPANPAENGVSLDGSPRSPDIRSYTVKVGDLCFVAIGQIVGREYNPVRYQPTGCFVLNSPPRDSGFRNQVRAIWRSHDARRKLFDSLWADYTTIGIANGNSMDGYEYASELQCGAALRLLFYFPKETEALLASRLETLIVTKDTRSDEFKRRLLENGVRSENFVRAVSWSKVPRIRSGVNAVFVRAGNLADLLAALPAVEDKALIRSRLDTELDASPIDDSSATTFTNDNRLLQAVLQISPGVARDVFEYYLKNPTVVRCWVVCATLMGETVSWDVDVLRPMLTDTRPFCGRRVVLPAHQLPGRICDEAATALSLNHAEVKFAFAGDYADADRQIVAIRQILNTWKLKR